MTTQTIVGRNSTQVGVSWPRHRSQSKPATAVHKAAIKEISMTPERVLVLLDIMEKAARSPTLSHLSSAALEALKAANLYTVESDDEEETPSSPPPRTPTTPRAPTLADTRRA
jgi:hypothetical protein